MASATASSSAVPCFASFGRFSGFRFACADIHSLCSANQRGSGATMRAGEPSRATTVRARSEEHTSELQSLMRNSYAVFRLKKKLKSLLALNREELNTSEHA